MLLPCLAGCSTTSWPAADRSFVFERDTLAFTNLLAWTYGPDADGRWRGRPREPQPDYTLRCFPMARAVKQFFLHARFDPDQSAAHPATLARSIREVLDRSARAASPLERRVVINGFAGLRELSSAHPAALQAACGGAADSYLQRGHWRMFFPFPAGQREATAARLAAKVRAGHPAVLHLVRFPDTDAINHAVVAFGVRETEDAWEFTLYDPNQPMAPVTLRFDRARRSFEFPRNAYFEGGPLHVYEVYDRWYN